MADLHDLARKIRKLDTQLAKCSRCGMCQGVCPLFAETGREGDVARGKLALLDGLADALFDNPVLTAERLHRCLLCGSCEKSCSCGVPVLDIFLKARSILTDTMGLPPAKKMVLRQLLTRPETFDRLMKWASRGQRLITRPVDDRLGTSCSRVGLPVLKNRHFVRLATHPFHQTTPSLNTRPGRSGLSVAFFPGCLLDKVFPNVARDTVRVLAAAGVGLFMPAGMGCCGIPAAAAGDEAAVHRLIRHHTTLLASSSWDYLVTACATCTFTIKKVWPLVTDRTDRVTADRVAAIADKVMDIHEFLAMHTTLPPGSPSENAAPVTYHDPCHLKKSLGIWQEPRALIRSHSRYHLVEMESADRCCGMGGSFNIEHYGLSSDIGRKKRAAIEATGATTVATGCPACMLQLSDLLSQAAAGMRVRHVIELVAEGLPR